VRRILEWLGQIKLLLLDATSLTAREVTLAADSQIAPASDSFSLSGGWAWSLGDPSGHLAQFSQAVLNKMNRNFFLQI
jgi:hypothetical protein